MKFGRSPIPEWRCKEIRSGSPITPDEEAAHSAWLDLRKQALTEAGLKGWEVRKKKRSQRTEGEGK